MEPWLVRALLLSSTFACAYIVFVYRDYALNKGWSTGSWAYKDTSWIKLLAVTAMLGTLLLGLLKGPWWLLLVVPIAGFFVALLATNVFRSLIQPIAILGLAIGWFSSLVWLPSDSQHNWSVEEIQNAQHLTASQKLNKEAIQISNTGGPGFVPPAVSEKLLGLHQTALGHAELVRDEVLAKAHPDLQHHFRAEYQRSLKLMVEAFVEGDTAKSIEASILHDQWVDWWNANKGDIQLPRK